MKKDDSNVGKGRDTSKVSESSDHDKHNPFKDASVPQNQRESTKEEEALAEQQRKETLTERD